MSTGAFARATALYAVAAFIPRLGLFLLLPVYARAMTAADVGVFALMMSLAGLLSIGYRLGLDATLLRFHFDHERNLGPLYATVLLVVVGSIVVLSGIAALVLVPVAGTLFGSSASVPIVALAFAIGAGNSLLFIPSAWYRAMERPGRYLLFTAAVFGVGAAATLWLVVGDGMGVAGALLGQLMGAGLVVVVAMLIVFRLPRIRADRHLARQALRFGLPLVPHAGAAWVLNVSDRWLLALLLPLSAAASQAQVGIYWIGYQVGYAVALLGVSVQSAWLPIVYRQTDPSHGGRVVGAMLLLTTGILSTVAVALAAIGPELVSTIAGETYADAAAVLAIVAAASVFYGLYAVAVPVLLHERRTSTMAAVTIGAGLVNVATNIALIPLVGIIGSAVATLIANVAYAAVTIWLVQRRWTLVVSWIRLLSLVGAATALLVGVASLGIALDLWLRVAAAVAFGAIGLWTVRLALPLVGREVTQPAQTVGAPPVGA